MWTCSFITRHLAVAPHGMAKTVRPLAPSHRSTGGSLSALRFVPGASTCAPACPVHIAVSTRQAMRKAAFFMQAWHAKATGQKHRGHLAHTAHDNSTWYGAREESQDEISSKHAHLIECSGCLDADRRSSRFGRHLLHSRIIECYKSLWFLRSVGLRVH